MTIDSQGNATVPWYDSDGSSGTDTDKSDYVWNSGPDDIMVIQPGSSYADYSVRAVNDTLQEGNETFIEILVAPNRKKL